MRRYILLAVIVIFFSACEQAELTLTPTATIVNQTVEPTVTVTETPLPPTHTTTPPTPTKTPIPKATLSPKPLVVCMHRPPALSPFINSQASYDVLTFTSVNPVEKIQYKWVPRLVTHIPDLENRDVITRSITVKNGETYADTDNVIQVHYGSKPLILTQMVVTYTLKTGLKWSDSHPLTANDIAFGYTLAKNIQSYGFWQDIAERTAELQIIDDYQIRWEGLPGFLSTDIAGFLFPPQPEHVWHDLTISQILQDHYPPVTGPYRIVEWEDDTSITLETNPYYDGDKPVIDEVILLFPKVDSVFWPEMLTVGTCDILLPGTDNNQNLSTWSRTIEEGNAVLWSSPSETLLRLDFNVMASNRRSAPLREIRTRFGLANCVSREHLRVLPFGDISESAISFIPPNHPAQNPSMVWRIPYDVEVGKGILDETGWRDENGDSIREAHGIEGLRDNTPLTLTLSTSISLIEAADIVAADLKSCGVGIIIDTQGPQQLFASSSVSPLYAGDFQLALYYWHVKIPEGCLSLHSDHLPNDSLVGSEYNYGGYLNSTFDDACQKALTSVEINHQIEALHEAQKIISEDQPSLFLSWQPRWLISRPEVMNIAQDISSLGRLHRPEYIKLDTK